MKEKKKTFPLFSRSTEEKDCKKASFPSAYNYASTSEVTPSSLREYFSSAKKISILGIGNPDRGDDGAGILAISQLSSRIIHKPYHEKILLIKGFEAPENFTGTIRTFSPSHLLIIDACEAKKEPGDYFFINPDAISSQGYTTHTIPLSLLREYIETTMDTQVLFIGIEPASTDLHRPVSTIVAKKVSELATLIEKTILSLFSPKSSLDIDKNL
ncbi:MAG: hydrogenase 3 maturation endopeptidase HyCI [Candidatus Ratteibacteria bacterium]|jgi:hydrogenase 3 maturation protease